MWRGEGLAKWASGADPRTLSRQSMVEQERAQTPDRASTDNTASLGRGLGNKTRARGTGERGTHTVLDKTSNVGHQSYMSLVDEQIRQIIVGRETLQKGQMKRKNSKPGIRNLRVSKGRGLRCGDLLERTRAGLADGLDR